MFNWCRDKRSKNGLTFIKGKSFIQLSYQNFVFWPFPSIQVIPSLKYVYCLKNLFKSWRLLCFGYMKKFGVIYEIFSFHEVDPPIVWSCYFIPVSQKSTFKVFSLSNAQTPSNIGLHILSQAAPFFVLVLILEISFSLFCPCIYI